MRLSLGIGPSLSRHDLPPYWEIDFTGRAAGYSTTAPSGLLYSRASCADSVQTGTSTLVICPVQADVLRYGRALDAWDVGLVVEAARQNRMPSYPYWGTSGTIVGSVTRTASQADPAGGTSGVRLQATSGSYLYASDGGVGVSAAVCHSQWIVSTSTADLVLGSEDGVGTQYPTVLLSEPAGTRRMVSPGAFSSGGSGSVYVLGVDGRARGGASAGARDVVVAFPQLELGSYPTEFVPSPGTAATRSASYLRALSRVASPYLGSGRISIELVIRPKGARTEYASTPALWYVNASNYASFAPSTGVLTIAIGGATNTVTLPSWSRYDLVELWVSAGGSAATVVKYRLNGGSVTTLAVTGSALGAVASGDVYLCSANTGQHLSCWLYRARIWRTGLAPSWAV